MQTDSHAKALEDWALEAAELLRRFGGVRARELLVWFEDIRTAGLTVVERDQLELVLEQVVKEIGVDSIGRVELLGRLGWEAGRWEKLLGYIRANGEELGEKLGAVRGVGDLRVTVGAKGVWFESKMGNRYSSIVKEAERKSRKVELDGCLAMLGGRVRMLLPALNRAHPEVLKEQLHEENGEARAYWHLGYITGLIEAQKALKAKKWPLDAADPRSIVLPE